MISGLDVVAGRALRVSPRALARRLPAGALALALVVAACATSGGGSGTSPESEEGDGSGPAAGSEAIVPDRVGNVELEVIPYRVPDAPDVVGGPQLATMLEALDLSAADVSFVMAVDRASMLAIGRWGLPGRDADAILAAWKEAAGSDWRSASLGGEPALAGRGPDGRQAWAVARDGIFVYVVTDDVSLAQQAITATH